MKPLRNITPEQHIASNETSALWGADLPALPFAACRVGDSEGELARLRAEVAAKAAELRDAKQAEAEAEAECERLGRQLAAERLRAKVSRQWGDAHVQQEVVCARR